MTGGQDRQSALLTKSQRELLKSGEFSGSKEYAMRSRIRDRVQEGLLDFPLLLDRLPLDDVEKIFEEPDVETIRPPVANSIPPGFGFLVLGAWLQQEQRLEDGWHDGYTRSDAIENKLRGGIQRALRRQGLSYEDVTVNIEIDLGASLDELADEDLEDLSSEQLQQLLFAGEITDQEFADAVKSQSPEARKAERKRESREEWLEEVGREDLDPLEEDIKDVDEIVEETVEEVDEAVGEFAEAFESAEDEDEDSEDVEENGEQEMKN